MQDANQALTLILAAERPLTDNESRRLDFLARDFPALWNDTNTDITLKKRLLRAAIKEIVVTHEPEHGGET